jgi:hypothetical protein
LKIDSSIAAQKRSHKWLWAEKNFPQGLKPRDFCGFCGTTKEAAEKRRTKSKGGDASLAGAEAPLSL